MTCAVDPKHACTQKVTKRAAHSRLRNPNTPTAKDHRPLAPLVSSQ